MPYDSVYSEKRPPGTLRTAWRKFYSDASAMVGLYGCAGLAVLCPLSKRLKTSRPRSSVPRKKETSP